MTKFLSISWSRMIMRCTRRKTPRRSDTRQSSMKLSTFWAPTWSYIYIYITLYNYIYIYRTMHGCPLCKRLYTLQNNFKFRSTTMHCPFLLLPFPGSSRKGTSTWFAWELGQFPGSCAKAGGCRIPGQCVGYVSMFSNLTLWKECWFTLCIISIK